MTSSLASDPGLRLSNAQSASTLRVFLESLCASFTTEATQNTLLQLGVNENVVSFFKDRDKQRTFVTEFLKGMTHCGTIDLFENELPSLDLIWRKCKYVNKDPRKKPAEFNHAHGCFFYLIRYNTPNGSGAIYCGKSIKPTKRFPCAEP